MFKINNDGPDLDYWFYLIKTSAVKAYNSIKDIIGTNIAREKLSQGASGDTTLKIDKMAEDIIMETLKSSKYPFKLITEEFGEMEYIPPNSELRPDGDTIIVDPVDGSTNAAYGFPYSSICIAYAHGENLSDVKCGVVLDINTGDIYHAKKGLGAYKNDIKIKGNSTTKIKKSVFGINLSIDEPLAVYVQRYEYLFRLPIKVRSMGSDGLSLAMLAAGSLDTFLNIRKKTRILDIAASYIIALEAGVEVWDMDGNILDAPLALKSRVSFLGFTKGLTSFFEKYIDQISSDFKKQPSFYDSS